MQETQRHKGTEAQRKPASNGLLMPVFFVPAQRKRGSAQQ
jgi:hypothetical protein